jgi:excisionase family DNA binding protein
MDERLLTPADVAERCQISAKSVLRAIHRGELRAYRLGERGAYRLREADVDAWLEQSIVAPERSRPSPVPRLEPPAPANGRLTLTPGMGRVHG